ncbi:unnamed protein product [Moneuplotes crassus]|uniref:Queuine tRNA-ribosyltransferase catalytic subunit 1 n=1 Tax=Euplotes crassus TaxID=5936 RepID=A0AAD1UKX5_EUPCR|nr:unnamed protein product [Moneuplotes crassus]
MENSPLKVGDASAQESKKEEVKELVRMNISALQFKVLKQWGFARASLLTLPHGDVRTPVYMPVGTKGAMKGLLPKNMKDDIDCEIMLANTYHLFLKPGEEILDREGGLHKFAAWDKNYLTDSGGFQIVSLSDLNEVTEEGVTFESHIDKMKFLLTPERSMEVQNSIGADIMMALDDVVPPTITDADRLEEAMHRSVRWLDRCILAHKKPEVQNLFAIVQGGCDDDLRKICCDEMIKRNTPGYAIGGLAGGEDKEDFWRTVHTCTQLLPDDKPRYVMGIGYPVDILICSLLGADMYDCVYATRVARFGTVFTRNGEIKLRGSSNKNQFIPIDSKCQCYTCKNYTRSYLWQSFTRDSSCLQLLSLHNVYFLLDIIREFRQAILDENVEEYMTNFVTDYYITEKDGVPQWVKNALKAGGIDMS